MGHLTLVIYGVIGTSNVTDEELITAMAGDESPLNSRRPLTYQSANPRDIVPFTPNHFLHGQLGGQFVHETVDTTEFSALWRMVQEIISQVWRRWLQEYLPLLSRRPNTSGQRSKGGLCRACFGVKTAQGTMASRPHH